MSRVSRLASKSRDVSSGRDASNTGAKFLITKFQITKFLITKFLITKFLVTNFLIYTDPHFRKFLIKKLLN